MKEKNSEAKAVYAGTFDPVTNGHLDIIQRAAELFGDLRVAIVENPSKSTLFPFSKRFSMLQEAVRELGLDGVTTEGFSGLLVDYVREVDCRMIVRGLRAVSDYEYEAQMALMNRRIAPDIETVFLMTSESRSFISASVVREVARYGGDVSSFVPQNVLEPLKNAFLE